MRKGRLKSIALINSCVRIQQEGLHNSTRYAQDYYSVTQLQCHKENLIFYIIIN